MKTVVLNVYCSKVPCRLLILTDCGEKIKEVIIHSTISCIVVCTKEKRLKLLAKYNGITIYKSLYLKTTQCQKNNVNFVFNSVLVPTMVCNFRLIDANYGVLVPYTILRFKEILI